MSQSTFVVAEATTETPSAEVPAVTGETGQTTESTGHDGGHAGAFPPMDATTYPSQIFWLVVFFGLLYVLMSRLALPRMAQVLERRHSAIAGDLAKASALKNETELAIQSYEKALADARAGAQAIASETRARIGGEVESERAALDKTLAARIADAEARIAASKTLAMKDGGDVAAETAAEIVAELTGTQVSKADVAKAISGLKG
jgi:F-type H+-transporting ATPase subunit b